MMKMMKSELRSYILINSEAILANLERFPVSQLRQMASALLALVPHNPTKKELVGIVYDAIKQAQK